eukprot:s253_g13.t1
MEFWENHNLPSVFLECNGTLKTQDREFRGGRPPAKRQVCRSRAPGWQPTPHTRDMNSFDFGLFASFAKVEQPVNLQVSVERGNDSATLGLLALSGGMITWAISSNRQILSLFGEDPEKTNTRRESCSFAATALIAKVKDQNLNSHFVWQLIQLRFDAAASRRFGAGDSGNKQNKQMPKSGSQENEVMQRLLSYSPLVEVGAGEGQWQAELRRRGADVVAFDNLSSPSRFDAAASRLVVPGAEVQQADAEAAVSQSAGRTLLMVCLQRYKGETLIYVGEGRGGVNGDNNFFDLLAESWKLEDTLSLDTLQWNHQTMISCNGCSREAEDAGAFVCDGCKGHWCDPCAQKLWGKGWGMLSCQLCNSELCVGCICACDRCEWKVCDRCIVQGSDKYSLFCDSCKTELCPSCNDKGKGQGMSTILSCNRCAWQMCDLCCMKNGKGKDVSRCDHCNTQLCEHCEGNGDTLRGCDQCDRQVCDRCILKGKGTLRCDHCTELCQSCSDKGEGEGKGDKASICSWCGSIGVDLLCESCNGWDYFADCEELRAQLDTCKAAKAENPHLKRDVDALTSRVTFYKGRVDELTSQLAVFKAENGTLQKKVNELTSQLAQAEKGTLQRKVNELISQLDAFKAEKRTRQSDVDGLTSQLAVFKLEKETLQREVNELTSQLAVFKADNGTLQRKVDELAKLEPFSQVLPSCRELAGFLGDTLPILGPGMQVTVPIQALRWTHDGINAQLAFGDDHEHAEESIFKLFEQLFRERVTPLELTETDPLPVFLHRGPDQHLGLYSRRNRRLTTLLMYQALRREELVKVHVLVRSPDDPRWKKDWQKSYDGSTGRRARARHCGVPLFEGNMHTFKDTLDRARARPHSQKVQEALDLLASQMKQRPSSRAKDEESVTFANSEEWWGDRWEEITWSPPTRQQGWTVKGRGRGKGKGK